MIFLYNCGGALRVPAAASVCFLVALPDPAWSCSAYPGTPASCPSRPRCRTCRVVEGVAGAWRAFLLGAALAVRADLRGDLSGVPVAGRAMVRVAVCGPMGEEPV